MDTRSTNDAGVQWSRYRSIRAVLLTALSLDLLLAIGKGLYGYLAGSLGMVADGVHSALHAAGGVIGLVGISLAARPPDSHHPYGYERYEPLASIGIAGFMLLAVWNILEAAVTRLQAPVVPEVDASSFVVMAAAILVTIALASWEREKSRRLGSSILEADARRIWSDVLISASVLGGLFATRFGIPAVDTVVSIAVAGMIGRSSWRIVRGASRVLTDATVGDLDEIAAIARSVDGVRDCHHVRARGSGGMVRVDLHITVDPEMTVARSHELADEVERRVRERISGVVEVLVHVGAARIHSTGARAP